MITLNPLVINEALMECGPDAPPPVSTLSKLFATLPRQLHVLENAQGQPFTGFKYKPKNDCLH